MVRRKKPKPWGCFHDSHLLIFSTLGIRKILFFLNNLDTNVLLECIAVAIPLITSSARSISSASTKWKIQPSDLRRDPSSCKILVFPMRCCPVSSRSLPSRIFDSSEINSWSRPKRASPLTRGPVMDFMMAAFVAKGKSAAQRFCCQRFCCQNNQLKMSNRIGKRSSFGCIRLSFEWIVLTIDYQSVCSKAQSAQ